MQPRDSTTSKLLKLTTRAKLKRAHSSPLFRVPSDESEMVLPLETDFAAGSVGLGLQSSSSKDTRLTLIARLTKEIPPSKLLQADAAERTANHIFKEGVEVLSWIYAAMPQNKKVVLYYSHEILTTIEAVAQDFKSEFTHLFGSKTLNKLSPNALNGSVVYITICCGSPEELKPENLREVITTCKQKGASDIVVFVGEYENILLANIDVPNKEIEEQARWRRENENVLKSFPDVRVISHAELSNQELYVKAETNILSSMMNKVEPALMSDVRKYLERKIKQQQKQQQEQQKKEQQMQQKKQEQQHEDPLLKCILSELGALADEKSLDEKVAKKKAELYGVFYYAVQNARHQNSDSILSFFRTQKTSSPEETVSASSAQTSKPK